MAAVAGVEVLGVEPEGVALEAVEAVVGEEFGMRATGAVATKESRRRLSGFNFLTAEEEEKKEVELEEEEEEEAKPATPRFLS